MTVHGNETGKGVVGAGLGRCLEDLYAVECRVTESFKRGLEGGNWLLKKPFSNEEVGLEEGEIRRRKTS